MILDCIAVAVDRSWEHRSTAARETGLHFGRLLEGPPYGLLV